MTSTGYSATPLPRKASKVPTYISEDVIRDRAFLDVLVDVKVCAVDEIWSGLKLVVRKENRAAHINASKEGLQHGRTDAP